MNQTIAEMNDMTSSHNELNYNGFPIDFLQTVRTPFYYYDMELLHATIQEIKQQTAGMNCIVHYALKANENKRIISEIARMELGADLVSGGEIQAAIEAGFNPQAMSYSGVGKTDWEIRLGLEHEIGCFNVESIPELEVINQIAGEMGKQARIAFRVNPDIDAHTHHYITTGTADNKFGITLDVLPLVLRQAIAMPNIHLTGLHFHIGSQITDMQPFRMLCDTINTLLDKCGQDGIRFEHINVGGGLGISYEQPDSQPIPDFKQYFGIFKQELKLAPDQQLHFELGRSVVGQCGSLISRVTYVKQGRTKRFIILDAGMNDLVRPALYDACHKIQNLTAPSGSAMETCDVVGPVCESSDVFAHDCSLPVTRRGDLIAIRSAGAYGESMASRYNMRPLPQAVFSCPK